MSVSRRHKCTPEASEVKPTEDDAEFSPFYNETSKKMFQELWLASIADTNDLTQEPLSGYFGNSNVDSSVSARDQRKPMDKRFRKILHRSYQSMYPDVKESESMIVGRKIRIFPSEQQGDLFRRCAGTTRYLYNKTLAAIKEAYEEARENIELKRQKGCIHMIRKKTVGKKVNPEKKQCCVKICEGSKYFCKRHEKAKVKYNVPLSFQYWRDRIILSNDELPENEKWLAEIPYDTRQLVVKNVLAGYKSAITNYQRGHNKGFDMRFKSKKDQNQFFFVDYRSLRDDRVLWPSKFDHPLKMRKGEKKWFDEFVSTHKIRKIPKPDPKSKIKKPKQNKKDDERKDMIITREYPGRYYLHIPYVKQAVKEPSKNLVVSIDPGIRTFHAFYDPEGAHGKLGNQLGAKLLKINQKVDTLKSRQSKYYKKYNDLSQKQNRLKRQIMRKKCAWLKTKAKHIVNDFHWKVASFYCKNYEYIIIPKLNVKSLQVALKKNPHAERKGKNINKMMDLAHCRFVDRLVFKAKQYNRKVMIVEEHYTSKTCGNCGRLDPKLGSNKVYNCPHCKVVLDRDINGARNILIKNLYQ